MYGELLMLTELELPVGRYQRLVFLSIWWSVPFLTLSATVRNQSACGTGAVMHGLRASQYGRQCC